MSDTATEVKPAEKPRPARIEAANEEQRRIVRKVFVGMPVLYYDAERPREGTRPMVGIVVGKGDASLALMVFDDSFHLRAYKKADGCKHYKDPTLTENEIIENGCWDIAPPIRRLLDLQ